MSLPMTDDWRPVLSRLSAILLRSDDLKNYAPEGASSSRWCGQPSAAASEIIRAEERLGVTFPPSYRSFLSISNGWWPFSTFIERLVTVQEVEQLQTVDPEKLSSLLKAYGGEDTVSDADYLNYETPRNVEMMRMRYYADSLLVGNGWGVEDDMVLLNPSIVFPNGEWEVIFFANWIPGNQRYRSFLDFVVESVQMQERF